MRARAIGAVFVAVGAALPVAALAQAYAGGSLGGSDNRDFCTKIPSSSCDKTGTAWRVFAGYFFTRNLGGEVGYGDHGNFTSGDPSNLTRLESHASDFLAVLRYPSRQFSVYGKAGAYYGAAKARVETPTATTSSSGANGGLTWGFGAQYDFVGNLGLRADFQQYSKIGGSNTGGAMDVNTFTLGLLWNFR
jgi:OmpA-OmpF porin, OOP family